MKRKSKVLLVLIAVCAALVLTATTALADGTSSPEGYWDASAATEYSTPVDTEAKVITISNEEELALFAKEVNNGTSYAGYTVKITDTLDMSAHYWIPIDTATWNSETNTTTEPKQKLDGVTIEGNGNTIKGIITNTAVRGPSTGSVPGDGGNCYYYAGFIGRNDGELNIENLTFKDANIQITEPAEGVAKHGSSSLAVIAGYSGGSLTLTDVNIVNCSVEGIQKVGGFVGQGASPLTVNHCAIENSSFIANYFAAPISAYAMNTQYNAPDGDTKNTLTINGIKLTNNIVECKEDEAYEYKTLANGGIYFDCYAESNNIDWYMVVCDTAYITYPASFAVTDSVENYTYCCVPLSLEAEIDGYAYVTLAEAIAAADNDTVRLLKNISYSGKTVEIVGDVTLDLNNYTIDRTDYSTAGATSITVTAGAKLTVVDNSADGQGAIIGRNAIGNSGTVIVNSGTLIGAATGAGSGIWNYSGSKLTVNNGTFTTTGERNDTLAASAIVNDGGTTEILAGTFDCTYHAVINQNSGTVDIKGGTYDVSGTDYAYAITNNDGCTMTIANAIVRSNCGAVAGNTGKLTIDSGSFYGDKYYGLWVTNDGTNTDVIVNGGTFSGAKYGLYAAVDDAGQDEGNVRIQIKGGNFSGGELAAVAINDSQSVQEWGLSISGGNYTSDPSAYVAQGYMVVPGDNGYLYQVTAKPEVDADIQVQQGETVADVSEIDAAAQTTIKDVIESSNTEGLVAAAGNTAQNTVDNEMVEDAAIKLSDATSTTVQPDNMTIVVQPYMNIVAKEYDADANVLTLDITPMYNLIATTNPDDITLPEDQGDTNAVKLNDEPIKMTVTTPVEISIELPSGFNTDNLYVKHTKDNGTVYYYKVSVDGTAATFTVTHGFSEMMFKADARTGKINFTYYNGSTSEVDYTPVNVGDALPSDSRSGYRFQGWLIDGDTYTTLTDELLTKLSETGGSVVAEPVFTEIIDNEDEGEYRIRIVVTGNGSVESSDNYADEGDKITLTVDPDRGYELYSLTITDASGDRVSYRDRGDGEYTFTMPDSRVTVRAIFVEINEGLPFVDVSSNAWYYDAVEYVYDNDLFEGMSAYIFGPNEPMNRGMLVTVLYRLEGEPRVNGDNNFSDVGDNLWYSDAVVWANSHGIVEGYNGSFRPLDNINREEMAAVMYRYAVYKGLDVVTLEENLGGFVDGSEVSDWAVQSMNWAVGQGVLHGKGANNLDPQGIATRAEVAQILMNYLER